MITDRDIDILRLVVRYYILNRPQIQRLCFKDHDSPRVSRRRLQTLVSANLINRHNLVFHHPRAGSPGPVYYPSRRGCEFLADYFDDEKYLLTPNQAPQSHHVFHWLAVSDTHITIDEAIATQDDVRLDGWLNEWDVVNKDESVPERRFQLYTLLRESPRLVCAPDAAFVLWVRQHKKVFYLEQDRDTCAARRVAASKTKGFHEMAARGLHLRHFPQATVPAFTVLLIAPKARRRDALRRAFRGKPGADLWKFAAATDLSADSFLHEPVLYPCEGDPMPLVKKDVLAGLSQPESESQDHKQA